MQIDILDKIQSVAWKPLILVVGSSFLLANFASIFLVNLILDEPDTSVDSQIKKAPSNSAEIAEQTITRKDIKNIVDRNIFNSEGTVPEDQATQKTDVKTKGELIPTDLPLKLHGTIYGTYSSASIAIIENTSKKSINSFMVGDRITENAIIKEIERERVIFDRDGVFEFVEIEKTKIERRRSRKTDTPKPTTTKSGLSELASSPPPPEYKEEGFERKGTKVQMTKDYKNNLIGAQLAKVLADAKAEPHLVDGEIKGYVLTKIREDSIYRKMGLQDGDIIEEINGAPLGDPARAIRLLNSFRNETKFEINVLRNGTLINLNIDLQ